MENFHNKDEDEVQDELVEAVETHGLDDKVRDIIGAAANDKPIKTLIQVINDRKLEKWEEMARLVEEDTKQAVRIKREIAGMETVLTIIKECKEFNLTRQG